MIVAVVLSIAFPVCFVVLLIGCLDCLFRKRRLEGFRSRDVVDGRHTNAFSVDICDVPSTAEQVTIEPLPDILLKVSAAPALRPQITFVDRGEHASTAPLISVQRSFPRDHLTYLNEIGSGWFGKAIESEAIQIMGGSLKSHVVVKMLKDDASKLEQKQFLDEVHAYRCLDHANLMSLLGHCTETTPFLVILEFAAYGNLKSFLVEHRQDLEIFVTKNRFVSFALDAAAGLACLHRHDYIHNDLAARNCLVMSDYTLKIGDYGISDHLFKNEYYNTGTELLPVRWMAPETLVKSSDVWTTQPHNKMADVWSFGILLWEICSVGERPYDMLTDEAVLQGVIQDKLLLPSDVDMKLPFKGKLWSIMTQCWRNASSRLDVVQVYESLEQLVRVRVDTVDVMSDFDQKWNQLKQNQERAPGADTDLGSRIALAGSFTTDDSSSPPDKSSFLDGEAGAFESIRSDDLIIDVGGADDTSTPAYQSLTTTLVNPTKAADKTGQARIHRKVSNSSEDQVFVENEFTNTSVLQTHMAPRKSFDQTAATTGTPVFHNQSSRTDAHTPDSDSGTVQTTAIEGHVSPIIQEAKMKDIRGVMNDLSLDVEGLSLNTFTQETVKVGANPSNFDSRLLTDDEDFSDFVRTSPTAPSLDFTDFASADNSISAHDEHVDSDLQFEKAASSDVPGRDTETYGHLETPVVAAAENTSLDNDFDAFSDFVTSDPPNKSSTTEIITENLDTAPSPDKAPWLAENLNRKGNTSSLDDNMGTSDSDSDTFSDFVSSVPTKISDCTPDAKLAASGQNDSDDKDIAAVNVLSDQEFSLSFPKSGPESQNQSENLPTALANSHTDLKIQGSLKDFGYDSETSSVTVDFDEEKSPMEKTAADHNQNIFASDLFPSDLSSLSSEMSLLINDSLATSNGNLPVKSKQLHVDTDVQKFPDTDVQKFPDTDVQKFSDTDVQKFPDTDVQKFSDTDVQKFSDTDVQKFSDTDVQKFSDTDVQFSDIDVQKFSDTDVQKFSDTDVQKFSDIDVQFSDTDVQKFSDTDVQFSETDVQKFPDTDVQKLSDTDVQKLSDTDVQKFSDTDVQKFSDTDVQKFSDTDVQFSDTDVQKFSDTDVHFSDTDVQKFSDTDVQKFSDTDVQFPDTDVQKFPDTDVQKFPDTDVQKLSDTDVQKFPDTDVQKLSDTDVQFSDTDVQKFSDTDVQKLSDTDVQKFSDTDVQKFPDTDVRFSDTDVQFSDTDVQKFSDTDVQKFSDTDVQNFSDTDVQFSDTDVQKFPDTDVQKFPDTDVQKLSDTDVQKFSDTDVQFPDTDVQKFSDTDVQFPDTDVQKFSDTDVQKFSDTDVRKFSDTDVQKFSDTDVRKFSDTDVQKFSDTDVRKLSESTNVEQPLHAHEGAAKDALEQGKPPHDVEESNNSLESFDFLAEKFSSVAAESTDPADFDDSGENDDESKQESGSLDVQPGMSFDLLDSHVVQEWNTSIMSLPVEILGEQASAEPTEADTPTLQDDGFGFELIPQAGGSQQGDLITDQQKSNGDADVTLAEQALIDF